MPDITHIGFIVLICVGGVIAFVVLRGILHIGRRGGDRTIQSACLDCGAATNGTPWCMRCSYEHHERERKHAPVDREPEPTPAPPPKNAVEEVRALRIQAGDILIMRVPDQLSQEALENIRTQLKEFFPGHKCLVLQSGMELNVLCEKASEATDG